MATPFFSHQDIGKATADPFELFMARLVGEKFHFENEGLHVIGYKYKGKLIFDQMWSMHSIQQPPVRKP
jgi:hypothetical protein